MERLHPFGVGLTHVKGFDKGWCQRVLKIDTVAN
jgi:hypothetical protein